MARGQIHLLRSGCQAKSLSIAQSAALLHTLTCVMHKTKTQPLHNSTLQQGVSFSLPFPPPAAPHCRLSPSTHTPSKSPSHLQVSVVDVFRALAWVKDRTPKGQQISWSDVREELMTQFPDAESFKHLCVRLPPGVGHPIQKCIESWQDQKQRVMGQLCDEARRLSSLLQQVCARVCCLRACVSLHVFNCVYIRVRACVYVCMCVVMRACVHPCEGCSRGFVCS